MHSHQIIKSFIQATWTAYFPETDLLPIKLFKDYGYLDSKSITGTYSYSTTKWSSSKFMVTYMVPNRTRISISVLVGYDFKVGLGL